MSPVQGASELGQHSLFHGEGVGDCRDVLTLTKVSYTVVHNAEFLIVEMISPRSNLLLHDNVATAL